MTEFIKPSNQTLLWQTLHKHPIVNTTFPANDPLTVSRKQSWFKNHISEIYSSIQNRILTREQLTQLNKNSLQRMVDELRISYSNIQESQKPFIPNNTPLTNDYSRESILKTKTTVFERELQNKQNEYQDLYKKPTPPDIKFESTTDEVIHNMDELVQRQLKERENDLKLLSKPPLKVIDSIDTHETSNEPNIHVEILELPSNTSTSKKVSWDMSTAIESKIEELTKKYSELFSFLESRIPNFQNEFSQFISENSVKS